MPPKRFSLRLDTAAVATSRPATTEIGTYETVPELKAAAAAAEAQERGGRLWAIDHGEHGGRATVLYVADIHALDAGGG